LKAFFDAKKTKSPQYSMSAFIRRAGLGHSSRGYFKMIVDGTRNLSVHTIRRFIEALDLTAKEALYFENLVCFNQAKSDKDKDFYFQRLKLAAKNDSSRQLDLLESQYMYYCNWYVIAVRELVGLTEFIEEPAWIVKQLRGKISKKQAEEALSHLEKLGLIKHDPSGKLIQSEPLVKYNRGAFSALMHKFHLEMMDRAREGLAEDESPDLQFSCVTLSCNRALVADIKNDIDAFRDTICTKYGISNDPDAVVQLNLQLFQLTPVPANKKR